MFVTGKPFQLSVMEQSSLLGRFVSNEENVVMVPGGCTLLFFKWFSLKQLNLQMAILGNGTPAYPSSGKAKMR